MDGRNMHLAHLRAAEGQFLRHDWQSQWDINRWTFQFNGRTESLVNYSEIALTNDEADFAAWNLQRSATFLMASAVLEAIRSTIQNPKSDADARVANAYQAARMIRNAFSHNTAYPVDSGDRHSGVC